MDTEIDLCGGTTKVPAAPTAKLVKSAHPQNESPFKSPGFAAERASQVSLRLLFGPYVSNLRGPRNAPCSPRRKAACAHLMSTTNSDRDETALDPEATGKKLFDAAVNGRGKVVREILAAAGRGPYIDYKNSFGQTPLYMASYGGKHECVKMLLEHGAGVDLQTASGRTALIAAALDEKLECVKLLLEYGASVSAVDAKGKSALDHARAKGFASIVSILELSAQRSPKNSVPRGNRCDGLPLIGLD